MGANFFRRTFLTPFRIRWQSASRISDLGDEEHFAKVLDLMPRNPRIQLTEDAPGLCQEPSRVRAGRPPSLDDSILQNHRERLVAIFEGSWGEIGWKLRKCRKPDDLVSMFSELPGAVFQDVIAVFCIPSTLPASSASLRNARRELRALVKPHRNAYELNRQAEERLRRVQRALPQAKGSERKLVRKEFVKSKKEFEQMRAPWQSIAERERDLTVHVKLLEASFARRELFRFLKSRRYELNPLSLANAAAGLPYMGWRQSMRKCVKAQSMSAEGYQYQVFKAIRYLTSTARNKAEKVLVEHFRESIPMLPHRHQLSKIELAEKWFFLERALRETCRAKSHPKSFPFEITKSYFKQMQVQSATTVLLAERAKLSLKLK
jgi:hypothetical protein